jgi:hypothetical protein
MNCPVILRLVSFALLNMSALAQEQPHSLYEGASVVFEQAQLPPFLSP